MFVTKLIRCLSIPVTLRAALKHPARLLGNKPASLLQTYHKSVKDFDRAVHSLEAKGQDVCVTGTTSVDVNSHVTMLGLKRKRTD